MRRLARNTVGFLVVFAVVAGLVLLSGLLSVDVTQFRYATF